MALETVLESENKIPLGLRRGKVATVTNYAAFAHHVYRKDPVEFKKWLDGQAGKYADVPTTPGLRVEKENSCGR
jgi:hypothetical protein